MCFIPSIVPSFILICVATTSLGKVSTTYPWFCDVIWTLFSSKSLTGWLHPLCPNFNLVVFPPKVNAKSWCPKHIPTIGFFPTNSFIFSITSPRSSGSPGPFDKNTKSGFTSKTSFAVTFIGNTVNLHPLFLKFLIIFSFIPKSIIATCFPSPSIEYFSLVLTILTASLFEKELILSLTSSNVTSSKEIIPFIVP